MAPKMKLNPAVHAGVKKLAELKEERGLSDLQMSEEAGISPNSVYRWRLGMNEPSIGSLEAALNLFGYKLVAVPIDWNEDV